MNLFLRVLIVWIVSFFKPRLGLLEESRLKGRVLLTDLDLYGHMNNGRYLSLMDLGRFDLILRSSLSGPVRENRWNPVVAATWIHYRKPLWPLQAFELRTRIAGWTDRWLIIEQEIFRQGKLTTRAWVKGVFVGSQGRIATREVLLAAGHSGVSPLLPASVHAWLES